VGRYWRVLSDHGITRQRLESFDRAIRTEPQFFKDKKVRRRSDEAAKSALLLALVGRAPGAG
jgi:hypothetical protein